MTTADELPLDDDAQRRLRWRCRRGLLENDLFVTRFLDRHQAALTVAQARGLLALMELADNDLLDLCLGRREPQGELDRPEVRQVLQMMRTPERAPS